MQSGKQKKAKLKGARKAKAEVKSNRLAAGVVNRAPRVAPRGEALVNVAALAPTNSYGDTDYVTRGTYRDLHFCCADCGKNELWTATQQKWWYEVAKGNRDSTATRCRPCRAKERARKAEARRVHLEGVTRKAQASAKPKD